MYGIYGSLLFRRAGGRSEGEPEMQVATLQQVYRKISAPGAKIKRSREAPDLRILVQIERNVSLSTKVQQKTHTAPGTGAGAGGRAGVCGFRNAGSGLEIRQPGDKNPEQRLQHRSLSGITGCNMLKTSAKGGIRAVRAPCRGSSATRRLNGRRSVRGVMRGWCGSGIGRRRCGERQEFWHRQGRVAIEGQRWRAPL